MDNVEPRANSFANNLFDTLNLRRIHRYTFYSPIWCIDKAIFLDMESELWTYPHFHDSEKRPRSNIPPGNRCDPYRLRCTLVYVIIIWHFRTLLRFHFCLNLFSGCLFLGIPCPLKC